ACGHEGLPIFFDTADARAQFEREKKGLWAPEPSAAKKGVLTIPILPVQTDPLIALRILEHLPVRVATVTGVRWEDDQLNPTAYRASFQEYWDAIGGPRYNAARVFLLDLSGINRANPNFEVTRHLVKRCDVWLDSGGREPEEVMDGYMLDVERVVAGTKTLASIDAFAGLYALSTDVLQCIDWDGQFVWRGERSHARPSDHSGTRVRSELRWSPRKALRRRKARNPRTQSADLPSDGRTVHEGCREVISPPGTSRSRGQ